MRKFLLILLVLVACEDTGNNIQSNDSNNFKLLTNEPMAMKASFAAGATRLNYDENPKALEKKQTEFTTRNGYYYSGDCWTVYLLDIAEENDYHLFYSVDLAFRFPKYVEDGETYYGYTVNKTTTKTGEVAWSFTIDEWDILISEKSVRFERDLDYWEWYYE